MQCKSLWIKASAKCINVNVNVNIPNPTLLSLHGGQQLRDCASTFEFHKRKKVIQVWIDIKFFVNFPFSIILELLVYKWQKCVIVF